MLLDIVRRASHTECLMVAHFEIVDLGAAPAETVAPGGSFRNFDAEVFGTGNSAKAAMDDALNQMALDGFDTSLIHARALEDGWLGTTATTPAAELYEPEEGEELQGVAIEYHVLIRFLTPKEV